MTRVVVHISDPHFGEADPVIAEALLDELNALRPALVAISGDLTQRARRAQFQAAREWLDRLFVPHLVVPGNHDIPAFDVLRRFGAPRERFMKHISSDLMPVYVDDELAVVGLDTTKTFTVKSGHYPRHAVEKIVALLAPYTNHWRVVVAHHPFEHATGAYDAQMHFEDAGVDLVFTGHLHKTQFEAPLDGVAHRNERHTMLSVHAGTCMSTRLRGEPNGYNQLHLDGERVRIVHRQWQDMRFVDVAEKIYRRSEREAERMIKEAAIVPPRGWPRPVTATEA